MSKYGDTSVEAAVCYYEYGNALFRAAQLQDDDGERGEAEDDVRAKAALAAQKRAEEAAAVACLDTKPAAKESLVDSTDDTNNVDQDDGDDSADVIDEEEEQADELQEEEDEEEEKGVELALEMMETAWSILDKHVQDCTDRNESPSTWTLELLPRALLGIGDVLTDLERYADAADAYTRALDHRERALQDSPKQELSLAHLKKRRHVVEANVLVAEALLQCPDRQDVITTETEDVLVTAAERVDYARGYYDKGRDELQETVYLMGRIAESGQDLGTEKEDVCFLATLLMGVGTTLAEYDERRADSVASNESHSNKRQKT